MPSKKRLFFINVIGDWLLPRILTQMGRFRPCLIIDIVNKPCWHALKTEWDYLTENPPAPILCKPLYDGIVVELQLSYHGSNLLTYLVTPHFTTYEVGK
jgi:hypothetical protein